MLPFTPKNLCQHHLFALCSRVLISMSSRCLLNCHIYHRGCIIGLEWNRMAAKGPRTHSYCTRWPKNKKGNARLAVIWHKSTTLVPISLLVFPADTLPSPECCSLFAYLESTHKPVSAKHNKSTVGEKKANYHIVFTHWQSRIMTWPLLSCKNHFTHFTVSNTHTHTCTNAAKQNTVTCREITHSGQ